MRNAIQMLMLFHIRHKSFLPNLHISEIVPGDFVFRRKMKSARHDNTSNYLPHKNTSTKYEYLCEDNCGEVPEGALEEHRSVGTKIGVKLYIEHDTQNGTQCSYDILCMIFSLIGRELQICVLGFFHFIVLLVFFNLIFYILSLRFRVKKPYNHWDFKIA